MPTLSTDNVMIGQFTLISKITAIYLKKWTKICYVVSVKDGDNKCIIGSVLLRQFLREWL